MNVRFGGTHLRAAVSLVVLLLGSAGLAAQGSPRVTGVDPIAAKVGASVTVIGENLGKATVTAVYLSDSSEDHRVVIVDQTAEKIVVRIPKVKPGDYNVSIQIKNDILIQPVRLSVEE